MAMRATSAPEPRYDLAVARENDGWRVTSLTGTTIRVTDLNGLWRIQLRLEHAVTYGGGTAKLTRAEMASLYQRRQADAPRLLRTGARVRAMGQVETTVMEPFTQGDGLTYEPVNVRKTSFQCLSCGLVWAIRWHAETCGDRGHTPTWQQRYVSGPIVNGQPSSERFYPRYALGRAELP